MYIRKRKSTRKIVKSDKRPNLLDLKPLKIGILGGHRDVYQMHPAVQADTALHLAPVWLHGSRGGELLDREQFWSSKRAPLTKGDMKPWSSRRRLSGAFLSFKRLGVDPSAHQTPGRQA